MKHLQVVPLFVDLCRGSERDPLELPERFTIRGIQTPDSTVLSAPVERVVQEVEGAFSHLESRSLRRPTQTW